MPLRPRPVLVAVVALAAGGLTATALAVPPGGPVENPLGATVTLAQATVPAGGVVTVSAGGYDAAEHVSLKVDDGQVKDTSNSDVLATADAAADGTFTATVDLARATTPLGAGTHNVRLLSSAAAGARSIHVDFTVPAAATTTPAPPATPTATTPTTTLTTPTPPAIVSTALRAVGGTVAVRLRGGSAALTATLTLRTRTITVARAAKVALAPSAARTIRLTLTRDGKAQLRRHRRLAVTLKLSGTTIKKSLTLKAAA
ncbi:MAG TPA: hypothetical protein VNT55_17280 [Baekduia sp.]|nr:hypothetical protein [Baekduia sp.]